MAENIVSSLFGVDPQLLSQQRQATDAANAFRYAQLDPMQQAKMSIYQGGAGLGRAATSLLGGDPEMEKASMAKKLSTQFDITTSEGLRQYAQALAQSGAPDLAQMAVKRADEIDVSVATVKQKSREAVPKVEEIVNQQLWQQSLQAANGDPQKAAQIYRDEETRRKMAVGAASRPNIGIKTIDLEGNLRSSFLTEAKPYRDPFIAAGKIENLLTSESSLADKISKKQWGKLAGDATISNKDTEGLTQFGDLGTRLNGILSQFAEGKYSDDQRKEAINLARQIKAQSESGYNDVRTQYLSRGEAEQLNPKTMGYIAPALPKTSRSFVVGKVYSDKNGKQGIFEGYNADGTPKFKPAGK